MTALPVSYTHLDVYKRQIPFCKELYIERDDFMIEPPKKYFRLFPGNEVRLMPVSYTHLDVYKRQVFLKCIRESVW